MNKVEFTFLLVFVAIHSASSRIIKDHDTILRPNGMDQNGQSKILRSASMGIAITCEPPYGFLPCSTLTWGNLFLLVVYQYLLSLSDKYIFDGSNLFFREFGTGIFGGSLFYILGIFPQMMLVLVSMVSISGDNIASAVSMSIGVLAGSTIMNLTVIWGSVIASGSYNLSDTSSSSNLERKIPFISNGYGVQTDALTKTTARIMLLSMIPFLLLQLAKVFDFSPSATHILVLVTLIITVIFLISYCIFEAFQPWIQDRTVEYLIRMYVQKSLLPSLCNRNGKPNEAKIRKLFHRIDQNKNKQISAEELRAFVVGIETEMVGLIGDDCVSKVMAQFDFSGDRNLSKAEFVHGLSKWLKDANGSNTYPDDQKQMKLSYFNSKGTSEEQQRLVTKPNDCRSVDVLEHCWSYTKAAYLILLGTVIAVLLAQPLMNTLQGFADAVNIPSFLVSYFLGPFALNFRQGYRAIVSASEKTEKAVSLTLSQIYCGVFMNNVMGLAIFLAVVYIRNVAWDVSAEILVVLTICSAIGLSTSFLSEFPFWTSLVAYALYPLSLSFLYVLTTFLGWN